MIIFQTCELLMLWSAAPTQWAPVTGTQIPTPCWTPETGHSQGSCQGMVTVIIIIIVLLFHNNNNYCRTETSVWRVSTKTGTESSETSDISGQLWVLTELGSLWLDWFLSVILRLLLDPRYQWNIDISCQTNQWKLEFSWTFLYCQIFSVLEAK